MPEGSSSITRLYGLRARARTQLARLFHERWDHGWSAPSDDRRLAEAPTVRQLARAFHAAVRDHWFQALDTVWHDPVGLRAWRDRLGDATAMEHAARPLGLAADVDPRRHVVRMWQGARAAAPLIAVARAHREVDVSGCIDELLGVSASYGVLMLTPRDDSDEPFWTDVEDRRRAVRGWRRIAAAERARVGGDGALAALLWFWNGARFGGVRGFTLLQPASP